MNSNKCLSCFNCKSRIFKSEIELKRWCNSQETLCRTDWIRNLQRKKQIRLYWCLLLPNKPRMIFRARDPYFIENCSEKVTEIEVKQSQKYDIWQVKYIMGDEIIYIGQPTRRSKAMGTAADLTRNIHHQIVVEHHKTSVRIYDNRKKGKI